ncbi:protein NRT1/ PTR FAMILY 4.5-like [Phragmites australis]|uniref:protein NRT1/ PTR FAMILY 4.5-like n=1 Tax=Phragmites australis TaxID=29695 RepID=UPI002D766854|nr:protein NRT1/ PTR FAMILY 4.5-like [Phragmites australis]
MASQGLVTWKGQPVSRKRHGGVKATMFIYFLVVMTNIGNIPMLLNIVSYLHGTMHMGIADASTTAANFYGAICVFTFLGAFISDSYIKRFYTILVFAPIEILGYMLLACQAHFPSLHPPPCDIIKHPNDCTPVSGRNLSLLTLGLYVIPIGEGAVRVCAAALGGDQFDDDDPQELRGKISFFNWFAFCISLGGFVGLVFVVWVQNNEGWDLGFALSALVALLGTVVVIGGLPFYRHQVPRGSPLTRIFQVFVSAFRKRNLPLPENLMPLHEITEGTGTSTEVLERTSGFKFLDKAAVDDGDTRRWSLCTVTQVEEAKIILRMLPVFLSSVLGYLPIPLLLTFTVQQGGTMDTRLGVANVPPASLFVIPIVFQMLILVVYDRAVVPWLRRTTGYAGGITHLQRVGVGFASNIVALALAAVVEGRRRSRATSAPPMSLFWLTPQFFLLGIMDVTSFVGLLEFFYNEASAGMKSIGGAVFFCMLGVASWLGSFLIQVVNRATAARGGGHGWLDGANLNASRLDLFYWLLALFGLVSFFLYLFCAWSYTYRHDPKMQAAMADDKVAPATTKEAAV